MRSGNNSDEVSHFTGKFGKQLASTTNAKPTEIHEKMGKTKYKAENNLSVDQRGGVFCSGIICTKF